jgi:hypothetical protein
MVKKPYPNDFWKLFDQAINRASEIQLWSDCQNNIDTTLASLGITREAEEMLFSSYNDQYTLAMLHLYKACKNLK